MRNKKDAALLDKVADLVSQAYDIGHTHGQNPFRTLVGHRAKGLSQGWGIIAYQLRQLFLNEVNARVEQAAKLLEEMTGSGFDLKYRFALEGGASAIRKLKIKGTGA